LDRVYVNKLGAYVNFNFNSDLSIWEVIATISGAVAALAAAYAVYLSYKSSRERMASNRPYLSITKRGIVKTPESIYNSINIVFTNQGFRPAVDFAAKIYVIDKKFESTPELLEDFELANDMPQNIPLPYFAELEESQKRPLYILVFIKYRVVTL